MSELLVAFFATDPWTVAVREEDDEHVVVLAGAAQGLPEISLTVGDALRSALDNLVCIRLRTAATSRAEHGVAVTAEATRRASSCPSAPTASQRPTGGRRPRPVARGLPPTVDLMAGPLRDG